MREIDVYDFDKTIIPFDSGSRFALFCCIRYPWVLPLVPFIGIFALLGLARIIGWGTFKKVCFGFLPLIPREKAVKAFWDKYEKTVFPWFKERPRESAVISASPDFLLAEIQARLGFETLICTRHNAKTGAIIGKNCRGEEKVRRFYEVFGENRVKVCDVYSDSLTHDKPIFSLAQNDCYHIVKGNRIKFDFKDKYDE